jgi:hypothetical protein
MNRFLVFVLALVLPWHAQERTFTAFGEVYKVTKVVHHAGVKGTLHPLVTCTVTAINLTGKGNKEDKWKEGHIKVIFEQTVVIPSQHCSAVDDVLMRDSDSIGTAMVGFATITEESKVK